ncbi:MAG TPA: hypothetical protein VMT26_04890 [Candidatus Bathyarchaeia archaeon]|nr:hypothetical protein [Candidatus Bathyarchaeia archaeon]
MPATSIDTFFACSLMVLLVLSAMASTSKLLYPYIDYATDINAAERYKKFSEYLLLNRGTPTGWGKNIQTIPASFGLATVSSDIPYDLDIDKVSRLNSENLYAVSNAQIFSALEMSDVTFKIEIKPVFNVKINLTSTYMETNRTVYQFRVLTEKDGAHVPSNLKSYTITENRVETAGVYASNGETYLNATLSNAVNEPALLVVFAESAYDNKLVSFNAYAFADNSTLPEPNGTFLKLSPLNYTLTASFLNQATTLSNAYAFTFNYNLTLTPTRNNSESATYIIPYSADSSPMLLAVTGTNSSTFFAEYTAYPQVPLQMGSDLENSEARSNVFAYTYLVTINSAIYECTIWVGGPKE